MGQMRGVGGSCTLREILGALEPNAKDPYGRHIDAALEQLRSCKSVSAQRPRGWQQLPVERKHEITKVQQLDFMLNLITYVQVNELALYGMSSERNNCILRAVALMLLIEQESRSREGAPLATGGRLDPGLLSDVQALRKAMRTYIFVERRADVPAAWYKESKDDELMQYSYQGMLQDDCFMSFELVLTLLWFFFETHVDHAIQSGVSLLTFLDPREAEYRCRTSNPKPSPHNAERLAIEFLPWQRRPVSLGTAVGESGRRTVRRPWPLCGDGERGGSS